MKKNKKRTYKKLPKYALGTMKPIDLGYQRGLGIGGAHLEVLQGISLEPETQAMKANRIPLAMSLVSAFAPYITLMATNFGSNAASTASTSLFNQVNNVANTTRNIVSNAVSGTAGAFGTAATNAANVGGAIGTTLGSSTAGGVTANLGKLAEEAAKNAATFGGTNTAANAGNTANAGSGALGTVGTALGVLGSAYGLTNMGMQIADFGSHRSASDMLANSGKQFFTTDKGNQYQTYTGVNTGQETAYEKAAARSKQLGFGINSIGTGASLGGLIGGATTAGSVGGPLGMAIGAGVGLLLGGLGSLFGWGDNSEEVARLARLTNDNISMYNRLNEAVAKSKDVAAEFNNRIGTAALGKAEYGPMTYFKKHGVLEEWLQGYEEPKKGIATSMVKDGETAYNTMSDEGNRFSGKKGGDTIPSYIREGDPTIIYSTDLEINGIPFSEATWPVIQEQNKFKKIMNNPNSSEETKRAQWMAIAPKFKENKEYLLAMSDALNVVRKQKEMNTNKYKCGKLPGYDGGKPWLDYAFPAASGLFSLIGLNSERNRVKNATFPMYPSVPENAGATKAIDILGNRRFNADPILNQLHNTYRQSLYDINRMPWLGAGGLAIARANAAHQKNKQAAEVLAKADEVNNQYIADYANAIRDYGNRMQDLMVANNAQRMALWQQQNAAKENWLALNTNSASNVIAALSKDLLGTNQFHRALDYQDRILDLYGRNLRIEEDKVAKQWAQSQIQALLLREQMEKDATLARETAAKLSSRFGWSNQMPYLLFTPRYSNYKYGIPDYARMFSNYANQLIV